jgi:CDP-4-dehydro-6-deoxyglucose reductase
VILGEIRGSECFDLLAAMNTGHDGSMCTLHSNSPRECLGRMENMVMMGDIKMPKEAISRQIADSIDLIIQVKRLRDGSRRSYSMANAPHTLEVTPPTVELHIRHMPGGKFTDHVFGAMKEKEILRVEGPYGSFFLREDSAKPIVLLASGTGFAPIKALIEHMQHRGITRPATLYWGGRRPADLYMQDWVEARLAEMPNLRYVPVISNAETDDQWKGRTGFVHQAVLQDLPDLSGHQVYACGAPIVVESAQRDYVAAGLQADEFFADSFTSEADKSA